ncbi:MAG: SRPBCC family protein [Bacteroidetes bacterium]|nr:SRPBCC family protein [Bacteroidota bacterium]
MELISKKITVQKSAKELCDFFCDVKNFENLMPENISKFEVINEKSFLFALKGMPEISLEIKEINIPNQVILGAIDNKIPFTLISNIESIDNTKSKVEFKFQGDFNPMMAMMIKGPITKFLETLAINLEQS